MPPRTKAEPKPAAKAAPLLGHDGEPLDGDHAAVWAALTAAFPDDWVERLPRPVRKDDRDKGRCEQGSFASADGFYCGGWHSRSVHLSYVGHAGITMRLNDVLGPQGWSFTPYAEDSDGWPMMGRGQFYARLTIMGVTKWDLADNFSGPQEAYGDALRRCAMRFGVGTYLWSKSEHSLKVAQANDVDVVEERQRPPENPTHATHPDLIAPNGQPWRLHDGKANADALEPHQRRVWDTIGKLTPEESSQYQAWASQQLPPMRGMTQAHTDEAMGFLEELVSHRPPS